MHDKKECPGDERGRRTTAASRPSLPGTAGRDGLERGQEGGSPPHSGEQEENRCPTACLPPAPASPRPRRSALRTTACRTSWSTRLTWCSTLTRRGRSCARASPSEIG